MKGTKNSLKIGKEAGFPKDHSELIVYQFLILRVGATPKISNNDNMKIPRIT